MPQGTARAHKKRPGRSRPWDGHLACCSWPSLNIPAPMPVFSLATPKLRRLWCSRLARRSPSLLPRCAGHRGLFVAPTLGFRLLYAFIIVRLARRELVWINVTPHPTADWLARQITYAFPWNEAPRYLIRDRDRAYGAAVMRRFRAIGIRG